MVKLKSTLLLTSLLFSLSFDLFAQSGENPVTQITVVDIKTGEVIPFAHVLFKGKSEKDSRCYTTNLEGKVENRALDKTAIMITCIGYVDYHDTIEVGQNLRAEMYPSVFDIDEVVVTGQFTPQRIDKSIYKIAVINSKQIESKAATNLAELMKGEVNFRITQDAVFGSGLTIQGMRGNNVKVLIDGVPVIGRMGGDVDLSQLNLSMIDHIEVVEGPMSVIYGSNSLAGAINLITKENTRNSITTSLDAYYESVGVYNFNALASGKKDKHSFSANLGRDFFGGFDTNKNTRSKSWNPKEQYKADGYYIFKDKRQKLKLQNTYMRELVLDQGDPYFYGERVRDSYFYSYRNTTKGQYNRDLFKNHYLELIGAWSYYSRVKRTYSKDLTTLTEILAPEASDQDTSKFTSTTLRGTFSRQNNESKINYQMGLDITLDAGTGKRLLSETQEIQDYAFFLSVNHQPTKNFSFQPGLRVIYNTKYNAPLVPSLNIKWKLWNSLDMRASYARGFRSPTLKELYLNFIDINHYLEGNPNLKAENGNNFNLSFIYNTEKLSKIHFSNFKLDFFFNDIDDNIYLAAREDPKKPMYEYLNVLNFKSLGGSFKFEYKFHPYLFFTVGVGKTGIYAAMEENEFKFSDFVVNSDFSTDLRYSVVKYNMDISLFYKYNGRFVELYIDDDDKVYQNIMDGYHSLDISVLKRLWNDRISISTGVKNLMDNTNVGFSGTGGAHSGGDSSNRMMAWGRTYFIKFNMNFSKY
ncbi:MAG: TonB-dependent receptor [Bacteroidales bacterium]|nr:TonB-dependent receptor [Bacteroidales bacterium]MCF8455546.1 TonB-dependent receptor [Bacteroidales bacterium]